MIGLDWRDRVKIKTAYDSVLPDLLKGIKRDPYFVDWINYLTPIEYDVWTDIRYLGLPLYPQFPVGKYFVDFGDPIRKLAIEVDGWRWHLNQKKDDDRQSNIEKTGWSVYRMPGWMTTKIHEDFEDFEGSLDIRKYVNESSEGFLWSIYRDAGYWVEK